MSYVTAFLAASTTSELLVAGRAIYDSTCEFIPVTEEQELAYFRQVALFAKAGGSPDVIEILMCGIEVG